MKGYTGIVYLPAWITLVLWLFSDLAGFLGTMQEFGGIAHTAHMGGQIAGVVTGLSIFFVRKYQGRWKDLVKRMPVSPEVGYKIPLGGLQLSTQRESHLK